MNWWVVAGFIIVGVAAVYVVETYKIFWSRKFTASTNHPSVGKAPALVNVEALNSDDPPVTLESLRGNYVVLNFWGPWAEPCRGELPTLAEISKQWAHDRVRVVPVTCLQSAAEEARGPLRESAETFMKDLGVENFTVYYDPDHKTRDALAAIGAFDETYPTTLILDPEGRVLAVFKSYHIVQSQKGINAVLTQALKPPGGGAP